MKPKKNRSLFFLVSSILLIVAAIGITSLIERNSNPDTGSTDVRARASAKNALKMTAVVSSVDISAGTIHINNLHFVGNDTNNLGQWIVTPPPAFRITSLTNGITIEVGVDPDTFSAESHTLIATEIKPVSR